VVSLERSGIFILGGERVISESYSIGEFVTKIQDLNYSEIRDFTQQEMREALSQVKEAYCPANRYLRQLKSFNWFLSQGCHGGVKPHGVSDEIFYLYRPVCKQLVEKGELEPEVLAMFEG